MPRILWGSEGCVRFLMGEVPLYTPRREAGSSIQDAAACKMETPTTLFHLKESVYEVVLQKLIPAQIRQLMFYFY